MILQLVNAGALWGECERSDAIAQLSTSLAACTNWNSHVIIAHAQSDGRMWMEGWTDGHSSY